MVALSSLGGAGWQFFDSNGKPLSGGKLYTYAAGTSTPKATYTSSTGVTAHANPIILDSAGRISEELWLASASSYKFILTSSTGIVIWTKDQVPGIMADAAISAATIAFTGFKGQVGFVSDLASNTGADWVGFSPSVTGATPRSAQDKMRDFVSLQDCGAVGDGITDSTAALQYAGANASSIYMSDGTYLINTNIPLTIPKAFYGNGQTTAVKTTTAFTAIPMFSISPAAAVDPKDWRISDFKVTNLGAATSAFKIDLSTAGRYVSKLTFERVISTAAVSTNHFVELTNVNLDGLFTSVFSDNWSVGGYYLDRVGDSVSLIRNTTTGAGVAYYVNQLGTAAAIIIRDGNSTSSGGALNVVSGADVIFEGMQCECPTTFTGVDNAIVSVHHAVGGLVFNTKIKNCSINTQGNALYCVYVENADLTIIDGCNLYCDPSTGAHIYLGSNARNTVIGNNKYFSSVTGAEIDPVIVNNGVGTTGVWVDATITLAGWLSTNTPTENNLGYFKDRDGNVFLRGRVNGATPAAAGSTLFTLPVGYRPKTKVYVIYWFGAISSVAGTVAIQILPTGAVQLLTNLTTNVYFSTMSFSTR